MFYISCLFNSYIAETKICQLGLADPSTGDNTGNRVVMYKGNLTLKNYNKYHLLKAYWYIFHASDVPHFGMVQGNKLGGGGRTIDIVLPNGKMCMQTDTGIPEFDLDAPTYAHGLVEHRGIIYLIAGSELAIRSEL